MNLTFFICGICDDFELCARGEWLGMTTDVEGSDTGDFETVVNDRWRLSLSFRENNLNPNESATAQRRAAGRRTSRNSAAVGTGAIPFLIVAIAEENAKKLRRENNLLWRAKDANSLSLYSPQSPDLCDNGWIRIRAT